MKRILLSLFAVLTLSATAAWGQETDTTGLLTPEEFLTQTQQSGDAIVLDVRRPSEFATAHVAGALQLDWTDKDTWNAGMRCLSKDYTYYVYCRSGRRSHEAAADMQERGFKVAEMEGGILNWQSHGMPTVTAE